MIPFDPVLRALRVRSYCWAALLALVCPAALRAAEPAVPAQSPAGVGKTSEAPSNRFDLHYVAPNECPARREFIAWTERFYAGTDESAPEASAPSAGDWQALPGELAGSIQVKVVNDGPRYTAHLLMVDAQGQCATSRPPHSETACAEAVRAMAYSLAQALKAPPCAADAPISLQQPPPPTAAPQASLPPSPPPASPLRKACPAARPCPPRAEGIRGELGLGAGIVTPLADDIALGGALLVGFTSSQGAPSARVTVGYWDAGIAPIGHTLRAQLWSVGASFCPLTIDLGSGFMLPFCATAEVGRVALSGVGSAVAGAEPAATGDGEDRANLYLWGSLGAATRLRWESRWLSRWLFVEIEPNLLFPLLRHPVYVHQPSSEMSERQDAGQVGRWVAVKAHLNAGIVFP